jgi:hypothetical protein
MRVSQVSPRPASQGCLNSNSLSPIATKQFMLLVLGLAAISFGGCSDSSLTREKAAQLIKAKSFNVPASETRTLELWNRGLCGDSPYLVRNPCRASDMSAETNGLESEGLVTVAFEGNSSRLSLTEKGKQYAKGAPQRTWNGIGTFVEVITSTLEFGEITGITQTSGSNVATAECTVSRTVTPFGRLKYHLEPSTSAVPPINFRKYDDGWRIQQ